MADRGRGVARRGDSTGQKAGGMRDELFSGRAEPTKLIFNFLSLIRRGSSYGPLGLYAIVLVVLLPWWPSVHGAPLFRGCIILPLETRYFLPCPLLSTLDCANQPRTAHQCRPATNRPSEPPPTWRINSRETDNPPCTSRDGITPFPLCKSSHGQSRRLDHPRRRMPREQVDRSRPRSAEFATRLPSRNSNLCARSFRQKLAACPTDRSPNGAPGAPTYHPPSSHSPF